MTRNNAFTAFYQQLSPSTRIKFMHSARLVCGWSHSTFYYKVKHQNLSVLETIEIIKLAKLYGANDDTISALRYVEKVI